MENITEFEIAVLSGKTMMSSIYAMYTTYVLLEAAKYASMERIPRKLKKKLKKNKDIYAKYLEMTNKLAI